MLMERITNLINTAKADISVDNEKIKFERLTYPYPDMQIMIQKPRYQNPHEEYLYEHIAQTFFVPKELLK